MLTLVEVKTGIRQAVATGSARNRDLSVVGGDILTNAGVGALGGAYTSTDMARIISLALLDAFRKITMNARERMATPTSSPALPGPSPRVSPGASRNDESERHRSRKARRRSRRKGWRGRQPPSPSHGI